MKLGTLKTRLLSSSMLIMILVLLITGAALDKAFQSSLLAAETVRLERYFYLLFSLAELENGQLQLPDAMIEPDLEQTTSGVAGFVFRGDGQQLWRSASSALMNDTPGYQSFSELWQPGELIVQRASAGDTPPFLAHFDVLWETEAGVTIPYRFALVHAGESYYSALAAFRTQLGRGLLIAAGALLLLQGLIIGWALKPLRQLARALERMRSGETSHLTGHYPGEIQQVVNSLNRVLESESRLRRRYRNSLGDLAHSLKTPLAVLKSARAPQSAEAYSQQVNEQVERMDQVVKYQLQRAVSEQNSGSKSQVPVAQTLERLGQSLKKIYRDKGISLAIDVDETLMFVGDEQDFLEIFGNLLDNGFKYGNHQVTVSAQLQGEQLHINVDDDGGGIAESLRSSSLERGQRLDTSKPGQGIGLAICADIAAGYQGQLKISRSALGGARFSVKLPGTQRRGDQA